MVWTTPLLLSGLITLHNQPGKPTWKTDKKLQLGGKIINISNINITNLDDNKDHKSIRNTTWYQI